MAVGHFSSCCLTLSTLEAIKRGSINDAICNKSYFHFLNPNGFFVLRLKRMHPVSKDVPENRSHASSTKTQKVSCASQ